MKKEEFLLIMKELQNKLGKWKLEVGKEIFADFFIGCFYDTNESKWKVCFPFIKIALFTLNVKHTFHLNAAFV